MTMNASKTASIRESAELDGLVVEASDPALRAKGGKDFEDRLIEALPKLPEHIQQKICTDPYWGRVFEKRFHSLDATRRELILFGRSGVRQRDNDGFATKYIDACASWFRKKLGLQSFEEYEQDQQELFRE